MGCDIFAYLEFYTEDVYYGSIVPNTFCFAKQIPFNRCYPLFSLLSGVRAYAKPVYPVRNIDLTLKQPLSDECKYDYYVRVLENDVYKNGRKYMSNTSNIISRDEFLKKEKEGQLIPIPESRFLARNVNYHSSTYLNLNELMNVRKQYLILTINSYCDLYGKPKDQDLLNFIESNKAKDLMKYHFDEYENNILFATLKSMHSLEVSGMYKTRFVCWFES